MYRIDPGFADAALPDCLLCACQRSGLYRPQKISARLPGFDSRFIDNLLWSIGNMLYLSGVLNCL